MADRHTPRLLHRFGTDLWRHDDEVVVVSTLPSSPNILSGSAFGILYLWTPEGRLIRQFNCLSAYVTALACNGTWFAVGNEAGELWTGRLDGSRPVRMREVHEYCITGIGIEQLTPTLVTAGCDGRLRRWPVDGGTTATEIHRFDKTIELMRMSPDGGHCALAADGHLYDVDLKSKEVTDVGVFGSIHSMAYLPGANHTIALTSSAHGAVELVDIQTKSVRKARDEEFYQLAVSSDGRTLAAARRLQLSIFDLESGKSKEITTTCPTPWAVAFSQDGRSVLLGGRSQALQIYDTGTGRRTHRDCFHDQFVEQVQFAGESLIFSSSDRSLKLTDCQSGKIVAELSEKDFRRWNLTTSARLHPSHRLVVLAAGNAEESAIEIWDILRRDRVKRIRVPDDFISKTRFDTKGDVFLSLSDTDPSTTAIRIWSTRTCECLATLRKPKNDWKDATFHPTLPLVITCDDYGSIELWDYDGRRRKVLIRKTAHSAISAAGDGRDANILCYDIGYDELDVFSLDDGRRVWRWSYDRRMVSCAELSPSGTMVAVGLRTGEIELLDIRENRRVVKWKAHSTPKNSTTLSLAFARNGEKLVSGGGDTTVAVWDIRG